MSKSLYTEPMRQYGSGTPKAAHFDLTQLDIGFHPVEDFRTRIQEAGGLHGTQLLDDEKFAPHPALYNLTLYDLPAQAVAVNEKFVRALHQLMENCAVSMAVRIAAAGTKVETTGLWLVPSCEEIKDTLTRSGAQLSVLVDAAGRLWGANLYNNNPRTLPSSDKKLLHHITQALGIDPDKTGFDGIVAVDPEIELPCAAGGAGIERWKAYCALHTYTVDESLRRGNLDLVSYVWDNEYYWNAAMKSHSKLDWRVVDDKGKKALCTALRHEYRDPFFHAVIGFQGKAVVLDLRTETHEKIAALVSELPINIKRALAA